MVEPRKPTPMTPDLARLYARRFKVASVVTTVVAAALALYVHVGVAVLAAFVAVACLAESRSLDGWRGGYAARMREERAEVQRMRGETR